MKIIIEEIYYCEGKPLKGDGPWQRFASRATRHSLPKAMKMLSADLGNKAGLEVSKIV